MLGYVSHLPVVFGRCSPLLRHTSVKRSCDNAVQFLIDYNRFSGNSPNRFRVHDNAARLVCKLFHVSTNDEPSRDMGHTSKGDMGMGRDSR